MGVENSTTCHLRKTLGDGYTSSYKETDMRSGQVPTPAPAPALFPVPGLDSGLGPDSQFLPATGLTSAEHIIPPVASVLIPPIVDSNPVLGEAGALLGEVTGIKLF